MRFEDCGTIWAVFVGVWRCGERYILIGRKGVFFQVSVEVNRLRSFWVILAHFGVKSTPVLSNSNYC